MGGASINPNQFLNLFKCEVGDFELGLSPTTSYFSHGLCLWW